MRRLALFFLLALPLAALAQPIPDTLWTRTYATPFFDGASKVIQCYDGGFLLIGLTDDDSSSSLRCVKTDESGNLLWSRQLRDLSTAPHPYIDASDVAEIASGAGFMVWGHDTYYASFLAGISSNGDSLWQRSLGQGYPYWQVSLVPNSDGNVRLWSMLNGQVVAIRWSATGVALDTARIAFVFSTLPFSLFSVSPTPDGRNLLCLVDGPNIILARIDSNDDTLWTHTYFGSYFDAGALNVRQGPDGCIFVCGYIYMMDGDDPPNTIMQGWIFKTDSLGNVIWNRVFDAETPQVFDALPTPGGGCITLQSVQSADLSSYDALGNFVDFREWLINAARFEYLRCILPLSDGSFVAAGRVEYGTVFDSDFLLMRFGSLSAANMPKPQPSSLSLSQNYPNPFNPVTEIVYGLPRTQPVSLKVFDLLGREVTILTEGLQTAGEHRVTFDGSRLPSGVYFYRLDAGGTSQTRKMVLLK